MKVCVAGLGAIGGLFAARLAAAGHVVSALARGATLNAVRERGLGLTTVNGERTLHRIAVAAAAGQRRHLVPGGGQPRRNQTTDGP